jgi:hypothetical protein
MLIRSTAKRREKREENAASLPVSPIVVAELMRRIEDRTTMLDLTSPADAGTFALLPLVERAD